MPETKLLTSSPAVNSKVTDDPKIWPIWGGRGGGRHYMLYRAMLGLAGKDGTLRASRRELHEATSITSNAGLERSIEFLVGAGLVSIEEAGSPDEHAEERTRGKATLFKIRHRGSSVSSGTDERSTTPSPFLVFAKHQQGGERSPLPNVDPLMDIFGDEPHLLRLIDILIEHGAEGIVATPTAISTVLGISMSGAHEFLGRLDERQMIFEGVLDVERVLYFGRGIERISRLRLRLKREVAVRAEALAGRWVPRRFRVAQQFVTRRVGRWARIDWEAVERIAQAQTRQAAGGGLPWLEPAQLLALRG